MELRPYQQKVISDIGDRNVIVKMPTGSGKTLIAAECIRRCLEKTWASTGSRFQKAIFFVPTCDLVGQQAMAIRAWCVGPPPFLVAEFMGGASTPHLFNILVSTPEAFRKLQAVNETFGWDKFAICVFDEVHHVLKDHPYRKLAHGVRGTSTQVLGLSASLTYAMDDEAVRKALAVLSLDLNLQDMLIVPDEDLKSGGYNPPCEDIEIEHPRVKPEGVMPEEDRCPHLMHATFFGRLARDETTYFTKTLMAVIKGIEAAVSVVIPAFKSPLKTDILILSSWEEYAHKLISQHQQQDDESKTVLLKHLESWYVALRVIVQTWEEEEELVVIWLYFAKAFEVKNLLSKKGLHVDALEYLENFLKNDSNLSKVACLKKQLLEKHAIFSHTEFRAIIFVQQRITAHIINSYLNFDNELQRVGLKANYVTARESKITPSIKVSPSRAMSVISQFRKGLLNVIVATSVIEEGLDIPAANVVISFDHLKDSVELAQRFGRARQQDRRIVVMDQRRDRPIKHLQHIRSKQDEVIENFAPAAAYNDLLAREKLAQMSRERGARDFLVGVGVDKVVEMLQIYIQKTKAQATQSVKQADKEWIFTWKYKTVLRTMSESGRGNKKSTAREKAAMNLVEALKKAQV